MTYCLGIKVRSGLLAIADTRISSGTETTTARKLTISQKDGHSIFLMTSGLRSVRDKALTYFKEILESEVEEFDKLYKAVNAFGKELRRVAEEDRQALEKAGLHFNLHTIVGGQLKEDSEHKLFLIYPEGNWIEVGENTPFVIIGNSGYGKPILNRTLNYETELKTALKSGFLSFDSTRVSANDVDFPIDIALYKSNSFQMIHHRFEEGDMREISNQWEQELEEALSKIPEGWMNIVLDKLNHPPSA
jgi:putative proteasome-type protease